MRTYDELAAEINGHHALVEQAKSSAVEHAIAAGLALMEVRKRNDPGTWESWVADNLTFSVATAGHYLRLAFYRDQLTDAPVTSINQAMAFVAASAPLPHMTTKATPELKAEVRRMRTAGMTWSAIGKELGVSKNTAHAWIDKTFQMSVNARSKERTMRKLRQEREIRQLKKRAERDRLAKERGGKPAAAYSLIRRTLAELDQAISMSDQSGEAKAALREAMACAHKCEDFIVAALKGKAKPDERRVTVAS